VTDFCEASRKVGATRARGTGCLCGLVLLSSVLLGCPGLDERRPDTIEADSGFALLPEPRGEVESGDAGVGGMPLPDPGRDGEPALEPGDADAARVGDEPPGPVPPDMTGAGGSAALPRGADCTPGQICEGELVCGLSVSPGTGTGRVCCDQPCDVAACQGCSTGPGGGVCGPVGGNLSCTADTERGGACSRPGQCFEYCTVATLGGARVGACLVR